MSSIRLNAVIPDTTYAPANQITLPGDFRIGGKLVAATIAVTSALSLGDELQVGKGVKFTNISAGTMPYMQPSSDNMGLILAGGVDATIASRIALYGAQWPTSVDAGAVKITAPGKIVISAGQTTTSGVTFGIDGTVAINGNAISLPTGTLAVKGATDAASSTDISAAASITGGLAVVTAGGIQATNDIRTSLRLYAGTGLTISTAGSATGDLRIFSTSVTSIQTDGGVVVGGAMNATGDITGSGAFSVVGLVRSTNLTDANADGQGAAVFLGGMSVGKQLRVVGTTNHVGKITGTTQELTGSLLMSNTSDTLSLGTGNVIIQSGLSVARTAWFGATINVTGSGSFASVAATGAISSGGTISGISLSAGTGGVVSTGAVSATVMSLSGTADGLTAGTGTLIVSQGGMTVARSVRIGETLHTVGSGTFDSTLSIAGDTTIGVSGRLIANNLQDVVQDGNGVTTTAGGVFAGGLSVGKTLQVGGLLRVAANGATIVGDVVCTTFHTTSSADAGTLLSGAIYTPGGISMSKSLRVGTTATISGATTIAGVFTCSNTTPATSTTLASAVISGGLGVAGSIYAGAGLYSATLETSGQSIVRGIAYFTSTLDSGDPSTGSVVCLGGMGIQSTLRVAGKMFIGDRAQLSNGLDMYGTVKCYDTTISSSTATGAMVLAGGLGCAGNVNVGGTLSITNTATFLATTRFTLLLDSATPADGAAVFTGGVGIGRNLNVGGACSVGAALAVTGNVTATAGSFTLNSISILDGAGILTVRSAAPGIRVAGTAAIVGTRYVNALDLFSLGAAYTDTNMESFQITTTSATGYTVMSRALGTGTVRTVTLQAGATNTGQLTLNTDGTTVLGASSANATVPSVAGAAALRVTGGLSVQANIAVGGKLALFPSAASTIGVTLQANAATTAYSLVMPTTLPIRSNFALVSDPSGTLTWSEMTTANPSFTTVNLTGTIESTLPTLGTLTVAGGIGAGGNVSVGKLVRMFSDNGNDVSLTAPSASAKYGLTLPSALPSANNYALVSTTSGALSWSQVLTPTPTFQSVSISGPGGTDLLTVQGGAAVGGTGLLLNSTTSGGGVRVRAPAITSVVTPYNFTLPAGLPSNAAQMLISDSSGNLGFADQPSIQTTTTTFLAANNVTTPAPVTGLIYTGVFDINVLVSVTSSGGPLTALFNFVGYTNSAGYQMYITSIGDESVGLTFSINSTTGQILYTSANITGWTNTTIQWNVTQIRGVQSTQASVDGLNNVTTAANVAGVTVGGTWFTRDIVANVSTSTGTTQRCVYRLSGAVQSTGQWIVSQQSVGVDVAGLVFSVLPSGQLQYTSGNVSNWVRTVFQVTEAVSTSQAQAKFGQVEVLNTTANALLVDGGATIVGDLTLSGGNLVPRAVSKTGAEVTADLLLGLNCVHQYAYNGTAVNSLSLMTSMVENATYEVAFTMSTPQTLSSTTTPSFVQLFPNGSNAYGNVLTSAYLGNGTGTPAYTRATSNSFQFSHSANGENVTGHGFSGTFKIYNVRNDKNLTYNGGGTSGFAAGSGWWADTTTQWLTVGTLTASAYFAQWRVWITRVS